MRLNADGFFLLVKVQPGARQSKIVGVEPVAMDQSQKWIGFDAALKVSLIQVPEKGRANKALLKILATYFGCAVSALSIEKGGTSCLKVVRLPDGVGDTVA